MWQPDRIRTFSDYPNLGPAPRQILIRATPHPSHSTPPPTVLPLPQYSPSHSTTLPIPQHNPPHPTTLTHHQHFPQPKHFPQLKHFPQPKHSPSDSTLPQIALPLTQHSPFPTSIL
ncbi:hypothetical protein Pcinc_036170 [Petrolisthes cinctipes]|uniref:Uncharacterized protein n=1 Tax=Petrolisthes cinctipes TaxID=88211 RepID=A0AAE1BV11_PETCI|nr:hypothetical protein Pcinc_036170 [Petrolisthes cinctipes]